MFRWCVFFYLLGINTAVNFFNSFFRRSSVHDIAYEDKRAISPAPQTFVPPPLISPSPPRRQEPRSPRKSPRRPSSPPTKAVSRQQHCCRSDTDIILKRHLVLPLPYVKKWQKKMGILLHLSITLKRKLEPQMILFSSSDSPLSVFICWGSTGIIGFCDYPGTGTKQSKNQICHRIRQCCTAIRQWELVK